jgi:hypothetical protein
MSKKLETINIKGKQYVTVNERLKYFRENFKDWRLLTDIVDLTDKRVVLKASILNPKGEVVANGLSCEVAGSSFINKTSHIENAETSAWGRALGNMGIGVDSSVCSADEVANAILQQNKAPLRKVVNQIKQEPFGTEQEIQATFIKLKEDLESCKTKEDLKLCFENAIFKTDLTKLDEVRKNLIIASKDVMKDKLK